jgi:carbon monoxide dehydrogenase subunit G
MQVVLEKEYPVSAPVEAAWEVLSRVELLATCMPGASISERIDDRHFKGQVRVKVGPASANFGGDITLKSLDASQRQIQMMGKGADKGGSSASMDLTASVVAVDQATSKLVGRAEVTVTGKFAQFGGRMMNSVSDMILAQFAQNFSNRAQLQSLSAQPQLAPAPEPCTVGEDGNSASTISSPATSTALSASAAPPATTPAAPSAAKPAASSAASPAARSTSTTHLPPGDALEGGTSTRALGGAAASGSEPAPCVAPHEAHVPPARNNDAPDGPAPGTGAAPASELNALGLLWGLIRRYFAGLFGRK